MGVEHHDFIFIKIDAKFSLKVVFFASIKVKFC